MWCQTEVNISQWKEIGKMALCSENSHGYACKYWLGYLVQKESISLEIMLYTCC